ncbi:MAG: calcium/sodium antiporter [Sarcina sp.]
MNYVLLVVGFVLLIKGADFFVDGASLIAKKIGIPSVIVGLTIVSVGTSAPELSVSLTSAMNGSNGLAVGNVLGSNMFNTLVVLGATALISPLIINKKMVRKDLIISLLVTILLYVMIFIDKSLLGSSNDLSHIDGLILVIICIAYIGYLIYTSKKGNINDSEKEDKIRYKNVKILPKVLFSILGVICIVVGGDIVVKNATAIATSLGMSEKLIGLTIIAVGTSLPELVTSAVAAKKGENGIALGNVLGSNIFNILLILGVSSFITPISVAGPLAIDLLILILISTVLVVRILISKGKEKRISKFEGFLFIMIYIAYTIYIVMRN